MLEPWNDSSILPPPVHTYFVDKTIDLHDLQHMLEDITKILLKQSALHTEGAILSRFIYKFDKKFRNDIGYRNFKKVNTALRKYLSLNLQQDVEHFSSVLPSRDTHDLYLPTRQMFEYLLVRLLTFSKIMLRICVVSKQAAVLYFNRVKRGESHWMSVMPYAVVSRTWSTSSVLLNHACNWYNRLYEHLDTFKLKGMPFLPENYQLPLNLRLWLDLDNLDDHGRYEWSKNKCMEVSPILDDVEDGIEFNIFKYANDINEDTEDLVTDDVISQQNNKVIVKSESITDHSLILKADKGQLVSRESFKKVSSTSWSCETEKLKVISDMKEESIKNHCMAAVTSAVTLKKFLSDEEDFRNIESKYSLTKHLSFMQWQALKNNLLKLCDPLSKNRKIERKFQKIWKNKCENVS